MHMCRTAGWIRWTILCLILSCDTMTFAAAPTTLRPSASISQTQTTPPGQGQGAGQHEVQVGRGKFEDTPANIHVFQWANHHRSPALDFFFLYFRYLGTYLMLLPVLAFVLWRRRELFVPLVIALLLETVVVMALKLYFHQPRPVLVLGQENIHWLVPLEKNSFPSGDAGFAFAIAGVMMYRSHWAAKILWLLYALLIAYGRLYLGVHFPLDVVTGGLIGLLSAAIGLRYVPKRTQPAEMESAPHPSSKGHLPIVQAPSD